MCQSNAIPDDKIKVSCAESGCLGFYGNHGLSFNSIHGNEYSSVGQLSFSSLNEDKNPK